MPRHLFLSRAQFKPAESRQPESVMEDGKQIARKTTKTREPGIEELYLFSKVCTTPQQKLRWWSLNMASSGEWPATRTLRVGGGQCPDCRPLVHHHL